MNVWILYDQIRWRINQRFGELLVDAFQKRGAKASIRFAEEFSRTMTRENLPDLAVMRTVAPALSQAWETQGVRVQNSAFVAKICNDKWRTYEYLLSFGIESLPCRLFGPHDIDLDNAKFGKNEKDEEDAISYPAVLKSRDGHGGTEVFWVNSREEASEIYRKLGKETLILQAPASDLGKDLRVYVLGNRILTAMLRESRSDFRSNFCLGGQASVYPLSPEEERMARRVCCHFSFGLAGIDFISHRGKWVLNEIEDVVGCRMIYAKTDLNPADLYADELLRLMPKD